MKKLTIPDLNKILVVVIFLFIVSCNSRNNTPFPKKGTEYSIPVSKPLKFSPSQPLHWKEISKDSIKPPKSVHFDLNKLPVKPFIVNDFKVFKNPVQAKKLDWDNISDSLINLDTIASKPFIMKQIMLPKPVITKAGMPKLLANTTSGILQFGEEEGLPGSIVTASLVDRHGMVWLATDKGLCRYTGEQLITYSFLGKESTGNNYTILNITEDLEGQIWLVTSGDGIYKMNIDKGVLWHNQSQFKPVGLDVICDHSGNIWAVGLEDGIYIINEEKATIKKIQWSAQTKANNYAYAIKEDKDHNIWIGNQNHISIIDSDRKKLKKIGKKEGLSILYSIELYEDGKGDMWVGSFSREINCISLKNKTVSTFNAHAGFTGMGIEFAEDKKSQLWVIQNDSIGIINSQRTAFKNIVTNAKMVQTFKGTSLTDPHGNIWVGSTDKGAIILDPMGPLPEHLDHKNGLADNNVWGLLEDKNGYIWIGTYNGTNIYDPKENKIRLLGKDKGLGNRITNSLTELDQDNIYAGSPNGFSIINILKNTLSNYGKEQGISNFCGIGIKDNSSNIWIIARPGIKVYNTVTNSIRVLDKSNGLSSDIVWDLADDGHGSYWAASDSGIVVINPTANTIKYLREKEGLCSNTVWEIAVRNNGELWFGTAKGISIVDTYKNKITNIMAKEGLTYESIYTLFEYKNKMYAGSNNGLFIISSPDTTDGVENKNNKWSFVNYGKREGFPYNDYNAHTSLVTKSGQIWLGVSPVLTILTQIPTANAIPANVYITGISIMDQPSNWESTAPPFNIPVGLKLPFDQNSVNFSFSNNNITGRDKIAYRYILEGAEKEWSELTNKPLTKNYYNLSPGKYTFRVCSKGFNGIWSRPAEMNFTILPPWWKTWWAYCIYGLLLMAAIRAMNHYQNERTIRIEREKSQKRELEQAREIEKAYTELKATQAQLIQSEKMASLGELTAGIAHEIQNPINFVNNFSEVNKELIEEMQQELENGKLIEAKAISNDIKDNEQKINFHGKRADSIVKGMLQHSRSSSGLKEPTNINKLADEYLRLAYHGLRAKDKSFNATMKTDFDETIGNINIIPQDIGRVILNLITNAFYAVAEKKRASDLTGFQNLTGLSPYEPTVTVATKKIGDKVLVSVKDNGNGIPSKVLDKIFQPFFTTKPSGQGTGLGLSMSYEIVTKAHGGELKVETKEGAGTTFIIQLIL